jgi:AcrR family transcriptional regulator
VRKGEQTRQEIIRKAAQIFNQKGYDGAALSDWIAKAASTCMVLRGQKAAGR